MPETFKLRGSRAVNLILALISLGLGTALLKAGAADLKEAQIWDSPWGGIKSSAGQAMIWGLFCIVAGCVGLWLVLNEKRRNQ